MSFPVNSRRVLAKFTRSSILALEKNLCLSSVTENIRNVNMMMKQESPVEVVN